ncbi:type I phosphomannose isomerase catalytic subunit [Deinococcus cellulosilyticus]|uniref:Mannose-6-phosphate isomerase n=1 Tax=Deinococcus cellulosilyticus (strain DSM 18568 / NBRC 106333 / KACC 11606 / 5516J-15) TaxID=1223518 RepID=A0A511N5X8_DEIC1|nr:type I phosphomannose isomerase catalytic subunit [Deinococcus cellulosilyticus]GEM47878.1 mannose-6-phosphate isomerase [Deinococcus cellulosilyticus NBRC 106333 = KACC 11606]
MSHLLQLIPEHHTRVWGGHRLKPDSIDPVGEAWVVYEHNLVASGPHKGQKLSEVIQQEGERLLGSNAWQSTGERFPLLIKLLDCTDWLSIQVHPNDEQARELHGPDQFGKTEAWHVLEAAEGAKVIAGIRAGTSPEALKEAILAAQVEPLSEYVQVKAGDTIFMPAGTLHALGPGLFIYEVQQTSDITYRVYDWDRPASAGRKLHLEESAQVTRSDLSGQVNPYPELEDNDLKPVVTSPYFVTEVLQATSSPLNLKTTGESFHVVTVIEGEADVRLGKETVHLGLFETVLVPANAGEYTLTSSTGKARALRSSLP